MSLFFLTRRVLPRHSIITRKLRRVSVADSRFEFVDDPRTPSYIAEKMDEARDDDSMQGDEKMFKHVDSPDEEADYYQDRLSVPASMQADTFTPPALSPIRPLRLPASRGSTPTSPHMSPDATYIGSNRAAYPASATGPLVYPQSPLSREYLSPAAPLRSAPLRSSFRDSTGSLSPVSR